MAGSRLPGVYFLLMCIAAVGILAAAVYLSVVAAVLGAFPVATRLMCTVVSLEGTATYIRLGNGSTVDVLGRVGLALAGNGTLILDDVYCATLPGGNWTLPTNLSGACDGGVFRVGSPAYCYVSITEHDIRVLTHDERQVTSKTGYVISALLLAILCVIVGVTIPPFVYKFYRLASSVPMDNYASLGGLDTG